MKTLRSSLLNLMIILALLLPGMRTPAAMQARSAPAQEQTPALNFMPAEDRQIPALRGKIGALDGDLAVPSEQTAGDPLSSYGTRSADDQQAAFLPTTQVGPTGTRTDPRFGDAPLMDTEDITVTRWVDPEGRLPITYEDWKDKMPPRGDFTFQKVLERQGNLATFSTSSRVCVIVNATLYGSIQASVDQYASDLEAEGYTVAVYAISGGTPGDLRTLLQAEWTSGLSGCLLVGDLPVPWYEMDDDFDGYAEFPTDLYYMDLDGQWTDADADDKLDDHSDGAGDVGPEIWVGRLTASPLSGDEVARVQNYFDKNHQYRTGNLTLAHRALAYIDDDWYQDGASSLDLIYGDNVTVMNELGKTDAEDYKERLDETHRFVHVMAHSSPWSHVFSHGEVASTEIEAIDPRAFFYSLFACSNARYVEDDYMGGHYVFAPTYGLAAIGSTKIGGMLRFHMFYGPLGEGKTLGEAYHEWFDYRAQDGFSLKERQWHYGMTLLGDPTLAVIDPLAPTASIAAPVAHERLVGTTTIVGTAADASLSNYTLEWGPGTRPVTWTQLISASNPIVNSALGTWDTRPFSGTYTLKLTVNANGRSNKDRITARVKNIEITSPPPNDILGPGSISITGTAAIAGLQNYVVEYGVGKDPASWSSAGVALVGGGLSEVVNATLATVDTTSMGGTNDYTIRLTVNGAGGGVYQDKVLIHVDPDLQAGWPQRVANRIVAPSMAIGDIDGDGDLEIVASEGKYGVFRANVYAWHHNGAVVNGWPQEVYGGRASSPALVDMDRDGDLEIIVGSSGGRVFAWHHDGSEVDGWVRGTGGQVYSSPAVGDLDGDGFVEIVIGSFSEQVHVWHHDGTIMNGWPQTAGGLVFSSPSLGDMDGDGDTEIVVGVHGGQVYAWHHDGAIVSGWPVTTPPGFIFSSPALGDIDGDGDIETVIGVEGGQVYAWHHDGTAVSGWPQPAGGWGDSSPALGDMDGDGDLEIVVGSDQVYAWHDDGTVVSGWPIALESETFSSAVLGDIDGDGDVEVVIGSGDSDDRAYAWHHDGSVVAGWPKITPRFEGGGNWIGRLSSPILEDVDQDGDIEVTIGAENKVMMWDLAGAHDEDNLEWKMFHHDRWHTGFYAPGLPNPSPLIRAVDVNPGRVAPSSSVTITARVRDEDGISSVTAEIESPDETVRDTIMLYDDGSHDDGAAGDGSYGNAWTTLSTKLDYVVDITAIDGHSKSHTSDNASSFTTRDVAYVQYYAHTIIYDAINHDGTPNPGEYVMFSITLENVGVLDAPGVSATISTADPHVQYYATSAINFGDIAAGMTVTNTKYVYDFKFRNTCPHSHTATFDLIIGDSNGNTWTDWFDITIIDNVGPTILMTDVSPKNAIVGEPVTIAAYKVEDGSGISSIQAVIESPDETPVITVTLHDDGIHNDSKAGDGNYANMWTTDFDQREYYVDFITEDELGNVRAYDNLTLFTTQAFSKTADILFVPDYRDDDTDWLQLYYTHALDTLGYSYDVWDTERRGAPDIATLSLYADGVVIWAVLGWDYFGTGDTWHDVQAYLDGGGSLFVTGQNIAENSWKQQLNDYLHATYVQGNTDLYTLNGATGDPIGDGLVLGISGGDGANNQYNPDEIAPISPAVTVLSYDPSGTSGLRVDTGDYKVVFFSFGFEGINSASDRATVMGRVLNWLQKPLRPVTSFSSSDPDWLGQGTVFTNTTTGQGPLTYTWAFGDGYTSTLASPTHTFAAPDTYTVVLTATNPGGSNVATDTVTIYAPLASITVTPNLATVMAGAIQPFAATGVDTFGNAIPINPTWSTDAGTMAGYVLIAQSTPASGGHVTATVGDVSGIAVVNVTDGSLASISVRPNPATVLVNATRTFTATGADAFGNAIPINPTWSTDAGTMMGNVLTAQSTPANGKHVTATVGGLSGVATVHIAAGLLDYFVYLPVALRDH